MSQIRIDLQKALKKWSPVLENMGVDSQNKDRMSWMSEMAEYQAINENAYLNTSIAGMGGVVAPQVGAYPGTTHTATQGQYGPLVGSGDLGQNLLPVSMKIAAQTIGLDLVAVKPTPGPKVDLVYVDFQYDDVNPNDANAKPQVFKIDAANIAAIKTAIDSALTSNVIKQSSGGLSLGSRIFTSITASANVTTSEPSGKAGVLEFLGYSRIDGQPMFRAFRQPNAVGGTGYSYSSYDSTKNTFTDGTSVASQLAYLFGVSVTTPTISLVSALEDHIPGFVANFKGIGGKYPMSRQEEEDSYSGVIGPKISTKSFTVGTIEVSSALRRTEIEDIKANTGMDIVQKIESILVNELSQTISKQIVSKIFEMGDLNRQSAPLFGGTTQTIFDLDTNYVAAGPGGETTHAVQRKLITKMIHASNYIATEGRVGPAQFAVTNGGIAAALMDVAGYTINPAKSKINASGQMYPVGQIGDITVYVDPYMKYNDNRIVIGRKNNPDQPGIIFCPFLMAQSVTLMSEATFAPRMILRSRYAVVEVGFYPQKQYMTLFVKDDNSYLN